jgi:exopolyphosphatase/guanosine-5'-triphosphate,3'-diphosphate pyrophosphatase
MSLTRMPIRLGSDAFTLRRISDTKAEVLINTLKGFRYLIEGFQPIAYRACATSAMRTAENGAEVCRMIREACGIDVEIINGQHEARIIMANKGADRFIGHDAYLYVDVGGGSTELTIFSKGRALTANSFEIGTIRLLENQVGSESWMALKTWLKQETANFSAMVAIGSGGNINKLSRLAECKGNAPLTRSKLDQVYSALRELSMDERIFELGLRPDRADVIVPAAEIYLNVTRWAGISHIYVPEAGLADGIVRLLYEKHRDGA